MPSEICARDKRILYAHSPAARGERLEYVREIAAIASAIESAPDHLCVGLDVIEMRGRRDLRQALLRQVYDLIVLAGHGPTFGLFEVARDEHRRRCARAFAEELAKCCALNTCVLLMGCCSTWLSRSLAGQGFCSASFDLPLPSTAVLAFIEAFFDSVCAGWSYRSAYDLGCIAMAYDHPHVACATRWFEPDLDPERGYCHDDARPQVGSPAEVW